MKSILKNILKTLLAGLSLFIFNCTLLLPPVVITGTKTAAEKQIIGEQTELEKDVWMMSSAKTTSTVDIESGLNEKVVKNDVQDENAYTYKGFAILEAFGPELQQLKSDGVVGENKNGLLSNLFEEGVEFTQELKDKYKPDPENTSYKVLTETVKQVNQARNYIVEGFIVNQKRIYPEFNPVKKDLLKNQKNKYQGQANKGEYIQQDSGEWMVKK
ncbi:MAG: DUF1318 domain-containing protein [Spirochaetia bacterium]|nr:DUF1318 domain-containing protein [Spirochaetia bacterium]